MRKCFSSVIYISLEKVQHYTKHWMKRVTWTCSFSWCQGVIRSHQSKKDRQYNALGNLRFPWACIHSSFLYRQLTNKIWVRVYLPRIFCLLLKQPCWLAGRIIGCILYLWFKVAKCFNGRIFSNFVKIGLIWKCRKTVKIANFTNKNPNELNNSLA